MSRKSRSAYQDAFEYINNNVFKLSRAASFTTDYEVAMRSAIAHINPSAKLFACHFHFAQACKMRASQIDGFIALIRTNREAESIYYRLMSLPLLPVGHIIPAFNEINVEARALKMQCMKKFIAYYRKQWILKVLFIRFGLLCFFVFVLISFLLSFLRIRKGRRKFASTVRE